MDGSSRRGSTDLPFALTEDTGDGERDPITCDVSSCPLDMTLTVYHDKWRAGRIVIPEFHRDYVWDQSRASKLIESFLLGLPVPRVFLYGERVGDKLLVIDGQQRILVGGPVPAGPLRRRRVPLAKRCTQVGRQVPFRNCRNMIKYD